MMNRRNLIIAAIVGLVVVMATVITLASFSSSKKAPAPVITPSISPSAAASAPPAEQQSADDSDEAVEKQVVAFNNQPIIKALPKSNAYWSLEYAGSENGKYRVNATVFVRPGQNAETVLATQKPYINDFLKQTGQPADTLIVIYKTAPLESD